MLFVSEEALSLVMEIFEFFSFSCSLKPTETRNKSQEDDVYFID
jgi:hypothetical protein